MVHGTGSFCSKRMAAASEWDGVVPRHGVQVTAREPAHSGMAGGQAHVCGQCIGWGDGVQAAATLHGSYLVLQPHFWEGHRQSMGWGMCPPLEQKSNRNFHIAESAPKYFLCIHPRPLI